MTALQVSFGWLIKIIAKWPYTSISNSSLLHVYG